MLNPTGPSPEAESRLTFGVELEFLLATLPEGDAKILADEDSINHDIQRKLEEVGILATVKESEFGNDNEVAANIATNWILKTDCTVDPGKQSSNTRKYFEYGMEIISPPYYYDDASRRAVKTVVRTLRYNYLVRVNETTGLHVHVGNGYHGFEWPILRNFMAIAWTYERQILLLMPEIRLKNVCVALGTRNAGFNISNLAPPFRSTFGKRTIEFRQHPGTLDSEGILHWVHICVKLVEKACHVKDEELFERLRADVERPIGFGDENSVTTVRVEKRTKGAAEKTAMGGGHVVEFI
ncbi:hypothetical protein H4I96_00480 [Botrytis cinerea]